MEYLHRVTCGFGTTRPFCAPLPPRKVGKSLDPVRRSWYKLTSVSLVQRASSPDLCVRMLEARSSVVIVDQLLGRHDVVRRY